MLSAYFGLTAQQQLGIHNVINLEASTLRVPLSQVTYWDKDEVLKRVYPPFQAKQ